MTVYKATCYIGHQDTLAPPCPYVGYLSTLSPTPSSSAYGEQVEDWRVGSAQLPGRALPVNPINVADLHRHFTNAAEAEGQLCSYCQAAGPELTESTQQFIQGHSLSRQALPSAASSAHTAVHRSPFRSSTYASNATANSIALWPGKP